MLTLPIALHNAISDALSSVPTARWEREAQGVSERYRAQRVGGEAPLVRGRDQALGYAAIILPATYAQVLGACAAAGARIPNWQPSSLLDLGSGPGTALWAAYEQWPSIERMVAWEREPALITLGRELAQHGPISIQQARWERHDLTASSDDGPRYDVVVLAHVLNELSQPVREKVLRSAWQRTNGLLLIIEPGTSAAFTIVRAAREYLITQDGYTIAPCPHNAACPLTNDWCHFPQRLERPEFQRRVRAAPSAWEDAKFSYAAMARFAPALPITGRIIREPAQTKGYIETHMCTPAGIQTQHALKRDREAFRAARKREWGEVE